jgi:transcriptional regulator of met regulon
VSSSSRKKLLQGKRCSSHSYGIMTKMAEFDLCGRERLLESIMRNELAKLWENILTDFQSNPSPQDDDLWVEKIDEICDPCTKIASGV